MHDGFLLFKLSSWRGQLPSHSLFILVHRGEIVSILWSFYFLSLSTIYTIGKGLIIQLAGPDSFGKVY